MYVDKKKITVGTNHKKKVSQYGSLYEYACCYAEKMSVGISHNKKVYQYGSFFEYKCCH